MYSIQENIIIEEFIQEKSNPHAKNETNEKKKKTIAYKIKHVQRMFKFILLFLKENSTKVPTRHFYHVKPSMPALNS